MLMARAGGQKRLHQYLVPHAVFYTSAKRQRNKLLAASYRYRLLAQREQKMNQTACIADKIKLSILFIHFSGISNSCPW